MTHNDVHRLRSPSLALRDIFAVGERFELSKGVNPCWFSREVHSTMQPVEIIDYYLYPVSFITNIITNISYLKCLFS